MDIIKTNLFGYATDKLMYKSKAPVDPATAGLL